MHGLHLISILLLAASSTADNVGVGIAFGARRMNVPLVPNLLIAFITGAGTLVSMLAGKTIAGFLTPQTANLLGGLVIIGTGVWVFVQETRRFLRPGSGEKDRQARGEPVLHGSGPKRLLVILDNPCAIDRDASNRIRLKETLLLGLALTLNNLVNGLAAGIMGLSPTLTTLLVMVFSIPTIWLGIRTGCSLGYRWLGRLAGPVSGVLLVVVGILEILM